jgi:hypothetical protein
MPLTSDVVPFSELIQHPGQTTRRLAESPALRLVRRNQPDLYLLLADRAERDAEIFDLTTRLLVAIIAREPQERILRESVVNVFAWTRFLPDDAIGAFVDELVGVARASSEIGNLRPVAQVIAEWKHTAEVHADPDLHRALAREYTAEDDFGPVPDPGRGGAS